jgi:hypothetical protein
VKITPPEPGLDVAASAVSSSKLPPKCWSRAQARHNPAVSWLLAMNCRSGRSPGTVAIEWSTSVFLPGTGQEIHVVVDTAKCA